MSDTIKKEIWHILWVVVITVFVALAAEMAGIKTFDDVSVSVLAVLAVRTAASVLVGLLSKFVFRQGG